VRKRAKRRSERFRATIQRHCSRDQTSLVMFAYRLAKYGHREQQRDGGERYFEHPWRVAAFLVEELGVSDCDVIIAAFLHDLLEDSFLLTIEDVRRVFGPRVSGFVRILTKEDGEGAGYFTRIACAENEVRLIKISDRRDNLRTMGVWPADRQRRYIEETRTFVIPIAEQTTPPLAGELEELCRRTEDRLAQGPRKRRRRRR